MQPSASHLSESQFPRLEIEERLRVNGLVVSMFLLAPGFSDSRVLGFSNRLFLILFLEVGVLQHSLSMGSAAQVESRIPEFLRVPEREYGQLMRQRCSQTQLSNFSG